MPADQSQTKVRKLLFTGIMGCETPQCLLLCTSLDTKSDMIKKTNFILPVVQHYCHLNNLVCILDGEVDINICKCASARRGVDW